MKSSGATGVGGVIIPVMDSKGHGVENLHFQERLCRFNPYVGGIHVLMDFLFDETGNLHRVPATYNCQFARLL